MNKLETFAIYGSVITLVVAPIFVFCSLFFNKPKPHYYHPEPAEVRPMRSLKFNFNEINHKSDGPLYWVRLKQHPSIPNRLIPDSNALSPATVKAFSNLIIAPESF